MKTKVNILLIAVWLFTMNLNASTNKNKENDKDSVAISNSVFGFFDSEDIMEITLAFDIRELLRTRLQDDKNYDATLTVVRPGADSLSQDIKIKARGKMRRKYCSFPPLSLKIKDNKSGQSVFETGNYKMVTHCSPAGNFENYILKEYLSYKLYNLVTPYSFKARLVKVNYIDSKRPKASYTEYGFLIENTEQLAKRTNTDIIENVNIGQNNMDEYQMARVALFNYMIGNTDWSVQSQHNLKVLKVKDPTINKGIPVTYDFDYSGFVNTVYASPNEKIPINNVTERYFQGTCLSDELLKQIMDEFKQNQSLFVQTISDFNLLTKGQKKLAEGYINNFFKRYKKEDVLLSDIGRTCLRTP